jgi:ribosome-associated protein
LKERKLSLSTLDPALRAAESTRDKKALDIVVLDLRGWRASPTTFIVTGGSHRQLVTIADEIEEKLKAAKRRPSHIEGYPRGDWILMDYVDFVVHIFTPTSRAYYDLERLWGDAKRLAVAS